MPNISRSSSVPPRLPSAPKPDTSKLQPNPWAQNRPLPAKFPNGDVKAHTIHHLRQSPDDPQKTTHNTYPTAPIPKYGERPTATPPQGKVPLDPNIPAHAMKYAMFRESQLYVPSHPTSTRRATREEDNFTRKSHVAIQMDLMQNPGRQLKGEYMTKGDKKGNLMPFADPSTGKPTKEYLRYNEGVSVGFSEQHDMKGTRFLGHSHPPGIHPFANSASPQDHIVTGLLNHQYGVSIYLTDGQNNHRINPTDMGLERLTPHKPGNPIPPAFDAFPQRKRANTADAIMMGRDLPERPA